MDYYQFTFKVFSEEDFHRDLLINALAEAGFDTFEETPDGFNAFIATGSFDHSVLETVVEPFRPVFSFSYEQELIRQKNWNEVWESNFEPISVKDQCYVRATFHAARPEFPYEIVIDPKMAFGTGHHQTTAMMMEFILEDDLKGKSVLDMGCGTGILAILAHKLGASELTAIDYDPVCYDSTIENAALNGAGNIHVLCGSKEAIPDHKFDVVLANINRNILLEQFDRYSEVLKQGGILYISGFYESDLPVLLEQALKYSLNFAQKKQTDDWVALKLFKR